MNNLNIQWVTQDPDLFELDWLKRILDVENIHIVSDIEKQGLTNKNSLVICNHAVNYRVLLDKLRKDHKKYGVFLLSDENLIEPCEWLHDPACVFNIRNYVNPWTYHNPKVITIGLGFKRGFTKKRSGYKQTSERDYIWCFAGTLHGERKHMIKCFNSVGESKTHFCSGFNALDGLKIEKYREMLDSSVFALCPPGQDSMDSFRLYEALEAGCIPVALNRTERIPIHPSYWHAIFPGELALPFVLGNTWEECVSSMQTLIKKDGIKHTQLACRELWKNTVSKWKRETGNKLRLLETI